MLDVQTKIKRQISIAPTGCWHWIGYLDRSGYGRTHHGGKQCSTHRLSYISFRGAIPEGLCLDHLCRNPRCCNPHHLEAVTPKENTLRGISFSAVNARKTHCIHGHSLALQNVYRQGGKRRQCRKCNLAAVTRYKQRRRAGSSSTTMGRLA